MKISKEFQVEFQSKFQEIPYSTMIPEKLQENCLRIQRVCEDLSVVVNYILSSPHFDVLISKNKLTPHPQFPLVFSFCQNSVEQKLTHVHIHFTFGLW